MFEHHYARLVKKVMALGERRQTRNGETISIFGESLTVEVGYTQFPLLIGRRMRYKGVFGELAALLRRPKNIEDFQKWGCNYWNQWGDANGDLELDYGNAWLDYNGVNQVARLKDKLKNDPTDRRMIINAWRPDRLDKLSLPCCHYSYQFYVSDGKLDMIWSQRSVDMMIGLPADIILASALLIIIAAEFDLVPGKVKLDLGDCHIYKEHTQGAIEYLSRVEDFKQVTRPAYQYWRSIGEDFCEFEPKHLVINDYHPEPSIKFELKV